MKVIVDANVWLSYLLSQNAESTIPRIIRACLSTEIDLVVPQELISELRRTLETKPYFKSHISEQTTDQFFSALMVKAEIPPPLEFISSYVSDANDDYLIAYGLIYNVDHIVSGDAAVRMLGQVENMRIVKPVEFFDILRRNSIA